MKKNLLRVGIAGCGVVTRNWHIPAFRKEKNARVVAVCDSNEKLAASIAEKHGIERHYSTFADMIKQEQLDILDICVPHWQHAALSIRGIQAGCHILVEKPLATNCTEADEMIRCAEVYKRKICVVHNRLFHPVVMEALEMVKNGAIGTFTGVEIRDALRWDNEKLTDANHWCHKLPAGVFSEFLPHPVYLAERFIGDFEQIEVFAVKTRPESWLKVDEVRVLIRGKLGMATIAASYNSPRSTNTIDIYGTVKQLHVDVYNSLVITQSSRDESRPGRALGNVNRAYQHVHSTAKAALSAILGNYQVGHAIIIKRFIESILNNTDSPVSAQEGKKLIENLEMVENKIRDIVNEL